LRSAVSFSNGSKCGAKRDTPFGNLLPRFWAIQSVDWPWDQVSVVESIPLGAPKAFQRAQGHVKSCLALHAPLRRIRAHVKRYVSDVGVELVELSAQIEAN